MASVIVNLKIMPSSPDEDLSAIDRQASALIAEFGGKVAKREVIPIAFGLKALHIHFVMGEAKGTTEPLEGKIALVKGVQSVDVFDVRRTVG